MTQEELYWYEKRLYMQADAKEREIRDRFNHYIKGVDVFGVGKTEEQKRREKLQIESKCREEIEFARLTILEPILDPSKKARLQYLRQIKLQQEQEQKERDRERAQREKIEEQERKKREKEEKRLAEIRTKEAAERAKRIMEQERKKREERERIEKEKRERKEGIRITLGCFIIIGALIAAIYIFENGLL